MPDLRDTQAGVEILARETSSFQVTLSGVEALANGATSFQITQSPLLFLCSEANMAVDGTQQFIEVLAREIALHATQIGLEFMVPDTGFSHLKFIMRAIDVVEIGRAHV